MNDIEVKCDLCPRVFSSKRGKTRHQNICRQKNHQSNGETAATDNITNNSPTILIPPSAVEPDSPPDAHQTINPPAYKWNNIPPYLFEENVRAAYEKIVFWRKNVFLLPTGKAGRSYIDEVSRLLNLIYCNHGDAKPSPPKTI